MKNTLLMAISMGIMGSICANAEVSNAQLLVHLKNIRKEMICVMDENIAKSSDFALELMNEFYSEAEILQEKAMAQKAQPLFEVICNNILSFDEIKAKPEGFCAFPLQIDQHVKDELFKLYVPIFKKLDQKYFDLYQKEVDPKAVYKVDEKLIRDLFDFILIAISYYPECLDKNYPLLKLIDAKIAELEAQIS